MKTYEWRMLLGVVGKKNTSPLFLWRFVRLWLSVWGLYVFLLVQKKEGATFKWTAKKKKKTCAQKTRRYEDMYQHRSNNLNGSATEKPYFTPFLTVKGFLLASHGTGWCETAPDGTVYYEHYLAGLDRKRWQMTTKTAKEDLYKYIQTFDVCVLTM